ncbi:superoxide dismutase family protein [Paenibacillus sp. CC-CFT747]|nr:superoxide dismutase family protein [Paenibacillus sp. CC-CFT747]
MGLAILTQEGDGLKIKVEAGGLTAGKHGIHLHQVGKCEAPDFKSAGDHLNPEKKQHGTDNPNGHHVGDLPNLEVGADGKVSVELKAMHTTLEKGAVNSLFDGDGTALVIHEGPDDMKSDPAGNSGGRVLCGVVK